MSNFCLLQDERHELKSLINWAYRQQKTRGKVIFSFGVIKILCGLISNLQSTNTLTGTQVTNPWTYIRFAIWIRWQGLDNDEHRCERCLQIKKKSKLVFKVLNCMCILKRNCGVISKMSGCSTVLHFQDVTPQ